FVTPLNSTMVSSAFLVSSAILTLVLPVWKQPALDPIKEAVDTERQAGDHQENQNNMFRHSPALAGAQKVTQAVLRVDQFRQHDVTERDTEQRPEAFVNVRQREGYQNLRHDLPGGRAKRLRGFDIAVRHRCDCPYGVRINKRHAGDEDEHYLLQ